MAMKESVMESVFSFELWRSLLLVKLAVEEPMAKAVAQTVLTSGCGGVCL